MFATLSSFIWGSSSFPVVPTENASSEDSNRMVEDLVVENGGRAHSPLDGNHVTNALAPSPSLSDEEADWVFVNKNFGESNMIGIEDDDRRVQKMSPLSSSYIKKSSGLPGKKQKLHNNAIQPPLTRSSAAKIIPNSALQASSVLNAMAVLRPQQKAQRRQKEMHLKLKQLERTNLTREVSSSSSHPTRRRNRYAPNLCSRAVNNRKC